ncbi:DMT family transporter [Rouxiella silvae]|uniref:DMT family transporter n=1 Tax=Rouxiella silvae TaxID=1646373 RepID=A0AA40X135_9GAMM|nr:DMT family transporter [Rouxiella silvae]KQN47026.1 multidrug DMT transporter [Serratia sp. Leaf50]MBF6636640.1 DMT family transporter [Rouxiella silvae]
MNLLFPLFAVLIWSLNAVVSKAAAGAIDPAAISFYRWLLALITLTPFILPGVWRNRAEIKKYWWKFMTLGLLGMVLYQSLAYYAAHTVSALFMGIIASLIPLLTVLISLVVLSVVPTVGIALGSIVSLGGLIWLVSSGHPQMLLQQGIGMGELMMFAASASYALYGVLTKRWAIPVPNWQSLYVQIIFGVLMLLPNFLMANNVQLNSQNIPLVLFAGIPASIIAPFLWIKGVHHLGANLATIFMNLTPIFTAVIAVIFLHEQLHSYHLIGGGVTLVGVILAQRLRTPLFGARKGTQLVDHKQES